MWPPTLAELKSDLKIDLDDTREDARLTQVLDAAISYVEDRLRGQWDFHGDSGAVVPEPPFHVELGTLRQAGRWHERRRSVDGMVSMGELGAGRVPSFDPDIDKMLGLGRHVRGQVG